MSTEVAKVVNDRELAKAFSVVSPFLGSVQKTVMLSNCYGQESDYFINTFKSLGTLIEGMPATYGNQNGLDSLVYLHYFIAGCDWYITEKDVVDGVTQAYGYSILNGDLEMAEFGYISIRELNSMVHYTGELGGDLRVPVYVELDLHFEPETLRSILAKKA